MLHDLMKIFALLILSFYSNLGTSKELNYLEMSVLRNLHVFSDVKRGNTKVTLNSSKRFIDLYNALEETELSEINTAVEGAYNNPYKTQVEFTQTIFFKELMVELKVRESLIAEVNNPVFPELSVFNSRSDSISISQSFKRNQVTMTPKISFLNRWYIHRDFTLEEFIKDNVEIKLKEGKSYTPIYFDAKVQLDKKEHSFSLDTHALEVTNFDFYNYSFLELNYKYSLIEGAYLGFSFEPWYNADYLIQDTFGLLTSYDTGYNLELDLFISKLKTEAKAITKYKRFSLLAGYEDIKTSSISVRNVQNFSLSLSIDY